MRRLRAASGCRTAAVTSVENGGLRKGVAVFFFRLRDVGEGELFGAV
jgi:hypothetical protein